MVRMEIALFLVLGMVAFMYFTAEKKLSKLHKTFSVLLITVLVHLIFDGITIYTVNHLDAVPTLVNDIFIVVLLEQWHLFCSCFTNTLLFWWKKRRENQEN